MKKVRLALWCFGSALNGGLAVASVAIQGHVGQISAADAIALGNTVGCRVYAVSMDDTAVNLNQCYSGNTACCPDPGPDPAHPQNAARCIRTYTTNALLQGGYGCNNENTISYDGDSDQVFYELIDGEINSGTADHIGYFSVQGQFAISTIPVNVGDPRTAGCQGSSWLNCFTRADSSNARQSPLQHTRTTYGSTPNTIRSVGGLSPIPTVRVALGSSVCAVGEVLLSWDEPETYLGAMKNGVASPILGVNLYGNNAPCDAPPDGVSGWSLLGSYPMGVGATGVCLVTNVGGPNWFALSVRVRGPSSQPTEIETGRVNGIGFVGANSQCASTTPTVSRIVSIHARYMGRGVVRVAFTSGAEGGVSSFKVWRSSELRGPFAAQSGELAATGDGGRYQFDDRVGNKSGQMLYYRIEVLLADGGSTFSETTPALLSPKSPKPQH